MALSCASPIFATLGAFERQGPACHIRPAQQGKQMPTIALVDWRLADGTSDRFVQSLLTAGICVALVSGSFRSEIPIADQSRLRFLQKPVLDSDLAAAVGGLLDAI